MVQKRVIGCICQLASQVQFEIPQLAKINTHSTYHTFLKCFGLTKGFPMTQLIWVKCGFFQWNF